MRALDIWRNSFWEFKENFKNLVLVTGPLIIGSSLITLISHQAEEIPRVILTALGFADTVITFFAVYVAIRYLLKKRDMLRAEDKSAIFQYILFAVLLTLMMALSGMLFIPFVFIIAYLSLLAPVFILAEKDKAAEAFLSSASYLASDFHASITSLTCILGTVALYFALGMAALLPFSLIWPNNEIANIIAAPLFLIAGLFFDVLILNLYLAIQEHRELKPSNQ